MSCAKLRESHVVLVTSAASKGPPPGDAKRVTEIRGGAKIMNCGNKVKIWSVDSLENN